MHSELSIQLSNYLIGTFKFPLKMQEENMFNTFLT